MPVPAIRPSTRDSASTMLRLGADGVVGTDASEITRALAIGNERC